MDEATRQLILTSTVLSAAVGGILALVGAGMTAWFDRGREERSQQWAVRREQLQARRAWNAERVRHTRQYLWGYADLLALSSEQDRENFLRQLKTYNKARDLAGADTLLFGDQDLALAFAEVADKITALDPGDVDRDLTIAIIDAANELDNVLARQMDRAMSDEPLMELESGIAKRINTMMVVPVTPVGATGDEGAGDAHLPPELSTRPSRSFPEDQP